MRSYRRTAEIYCGCLEVKELFVVSDLNIHSLAPFGRRGWHMRYARVRGMILYIHKDDNGFARGRYETYKNLVMLHHSVAERPKDYNKRQHVFRLRTANKGEYLFQTR